MGNGSFGCSRKMAVALLRRVVFSPISNSQKLSAAYATEKRKGSKIWRPLELPTPGRGKAFRRIVHFKDKYTVQPLEVTNLAGRDPVTGRVVAMGIGGGIKHKFHQIQWLRDGPTEGPPKEEKVLEIIKDGCRTAFVALVGSGDELKYYIATENMKPGDIIKTSREIPRNPVRPKEGDAYPLGALMIGTVVHNIERTPGKGATYLHAAGAKGTILRKDGDYRVVIKMPGKRHTEFSFSKHCLAVVGQVSNVIHWKTPIGSAQKNRELGNRPRSGLWHRKEGRHGRKIKPPLTRRIYMYRNRKANKTQFTLSGM